MKRFLGSMVFGLVVLVLLPVSSPAAYMEKNTDRPGSDYSDFDLHTADPYLCQQACERDARCQAWTYVRPNTIQGPNPRCWLKNSVPAPQRGYYAVSGVVVRSQPDYPGPGHHHRVHVEGEWQTDFGMMSLDRSGSRVDGSYTHNNGRITGIIEGDTLRGFWFQGRADVRCARPRHGTYYWGHLKFVFDGRRFTGIWGYCEDRPSAAWNGRRSY